MLRLYAPSAQDLPAQTLSEFYHAEFLPLWIRGRHLSDATKVSYDESVAHWRRLTGDPPLVDIDDHVAAHFSAQLYELPGRSRDTISPWTARKHARQIQRILDFAGPRTRDPSGRMNRGLITLPPLIPTPANPPREPKPSYSTNELRALATHSHHMTQPTWHPSPPDYWRSLIVLLATTGLRIGQALAMRWDSLTPDPAFPGRWSHIPASAHRARKAKRQYVPAQAVACLETIPRVDDYVLPWRGRHRRWLDRLFHRLHDAASIQPNRRLGFHAIRRWHLTTVRRLGYFDSRDIAKAAAGHADSETTIAHYIDPAAEDELLAATLERLPAITDAWRPTDDRPHLDHLPQHPHHPATERTG